MEMSAQIDEEEFEAMLACRCTSVWRDDPCMSRASQEDGLCNTCRCEHGCCEDHSSFDVLSRCRQATWDREVEDGRTNQA
jgi:hypothetical protein